MYHKLHIILSLPISLWQMVITFLPGPAGYALRYRFWRKRLRGLGEGTRIGTNVYFQNPDYIEIGENCWIDHNVIVMAGPDTSDREKIILTNKNFNGFPGIVKIGKNVHVGPYSIISGISAGVYISDDCGFSAGCSVYSFSHHYRSRRRPADHRVHFGPMVSFDRQSIIEGPVSLGKNTGVALGCVILPGVHIPENCFVAINSVVMPAKFKANSIISGNPAKAIAMRFTSHE